MHWKSTGNGADFGGKRGYVDRDLDRTSNQAGLATICQGSFYGDVLRTMASIVELLLNTAKADTDLLLENDSHGDVFTTPRQVDFLLRTATAEKAQLVANFINDNRYGQATASSEANEHRVTVQIEMPITQNVLCSVSGLMACISKIFEVEYDGWGSVLKPRKSPPSVPNQPT